MRSLIFLSCLLSLSASAQDAATFDPGQGTSVPATQGNVRPLSQLVLEERIQHAPHRTSLVPVVPSQLGYTSQAQLDAAVRRMLKLPTWRRFQVVWEPGNREVSIVVELASL